MMKGIEDEAGTRLNDVEDHNELIPSLLTKLGTALICFGIS